MKTAFTSARNLAASGVMLLAAVVSTAPASATAPEPASVVLTAAGDILLDRGVGEQVSRYGASYPLEKVAPLLKTADIAFANLECPLSANGRKVVKPLCFQAKPSTVDCLVRGGINFVSAANNHTLDCGREGLAETLSTLRSRQIRWCGAGANQAAAEAPTVVTIHGIRVAFVGFCDFIPEGSFLNPDAPTIAFSSEENVRRAVAAARRQADVVVASFHWGVEFTNRPTSRQQRFAQAAIDAGASLVLGHHPHVLQGLQVVKRQHGLRPALIIYALGNFVFDQGVGLNAHNTEGVVLRCILDRRGVRSARLIPVELQRYRPVPASPAEAHHILAHLSILSGELNTRVEQGQVKGL